MITRMMKICRWRGTIMMKTMRIRAMRIVIHDFIYKHNIYLQIIGIIILLLIASCRHIYMLSIYCVINNVIIFDYFCLFGTALQQSNGYDTELSRDLWFMCSASYCNFDKIT